DRPREHRGGASGDRRGRGDRREASEVGRAADRGRGAEGRTERHAGRSAQVLRRQDRQVVDAGRRGLREGAAAYRDRQAFEAHAAPADERLQAWYGLKRKNASPASSSRGST